MIDEIKNYIIENIQNLSLFIEFFIIIGLFYIYKNTKIDRLIRYSIILSCSIAIICAIGAYYFVEIPNDASFSITKYSSIIRNVLLGIIALISFPFLVWRTVLASQQEKTTNKQADTALKVRIDKLYNDAVTQLSDDKETIRLASILTFQELLKTSDDNDFRKKIVDILWLFVVEHSYGMQEIYDEYIEIKSRYEEDKKKKIEITDANQKIFETIKEYFDEKQQEKKFYYSQFKIIIEIFTQYHDTLCNDGWWKNKSMSKVWLYKADLQYAKFAHGYFKDAKLLEVDLSHANLQNANLSHADLQNTNLSHSNLQNANLSNADLQDSYLIECDLRNSNLTNAQFHNAKLEKANLEGTTQLSGTQFHNANLLTINLKNTNLENTYLIDTGLTNAQLWGANLEKCYLNEKTSFINSQYNSKEIILDNMTYKPTIFPENFNFEIHKGIFDVSVRDMSDYRMTLIKSLKSSFRIYNHDYQIKIRIPQNNKCCKCCKEK